MEHRNFMEGLKGSNDFAYLSLKKHKKNDQVFIWSSVNFKHITENSVFHSACPYCKKFRLNFVPKVDFQQQSYLTLLFSIWILYFPSHNEWEPSKIENYATKGD